MRPEIKKLKESPLWRVVLEIGYKLINDHRADKIYWNILDKHFQTKYNMKTPPGLYKDLWPSICAHYFDGYILPPDATQEEKDNKFITDLNVFLMNKIKEIKNG